MEELYYWNGDKSKSYTWTELLFLCHKLIQVNENRYGYIYNNYWRITNFFKEFRHNENDGIRTRGVWHHCPFHYEFKQQKDENGRLTSEWVKTIVWDDPYYVPSTFTPKKFQVTDNFGRIIPSSLIHQAYLTYKFPEVIPQKRYCYVRRFWRTDLTWRFRIDPVPFAGSHRNGWWHKYAGKHAGRAAKKRAWYAHDVDRKEYLFEYGITYKMDNKELGHNHGNGGKGRTWKRTRVKKQWMRKLI